MRTPEIDKSNFALGKQAIIWMLVVLSFVLLGYLVLLLCQTKPLTARVGAKTKKTFKSVMP